MKRLFLLIILLQPFVILAQNAEFIANIDTLSKRVNRKNIYNDALKWEWKINGQMLKFGSGKVEIKPNRYKLDTILFRKNRASKYDTIITNISNSFKYNFEYNICCSYFNVKTLSDKSKKPSIQNSLVSFQIHNKNPNNKYLGIFGEAGIHIEEEGLDYELFHRCTSAMSSNIIKISVNVVEECKNNSDCRSLYCIFKNNGVQVSNAISDFKILSEVFSILYLPLGLDSLNVSYDLKNQKLRLKNVW